MHCYKLHLFNHLMVLWKTAHFQDFDEGILIVKSSSSCFQVEMPYSAWSIDVQITYSMLCNTQVGRHFLVAITVAVKRKGLVPWAADCDDLENQKLAWKTYQVLRTHRLKDVSFENMEKNMRQVREREEESNHFWLGLSQNRVRNWKKKKKVHHTLGWGVRLTQQN